MADKFYTPPSSPKPKTMTFTNLKKMCSRCNKEFTESKCVACVTIAAIKYQDKWQKRNDALKNLEAAGRAHASRQDSQGSCIIM
ncbi:unnamed protein product [Caenorhabditis brenneri]